GLPPDPSLARTPNRPPRPPAPGLSSPANRVASLRTHWHIPCHQPSGDPPGEGDLLNVTQAARQLQIAPSTLLRWLNDGFVAGEQVTPGADPARADHGDPPPGVEPFPQQVAVGERPQVVHAAEVGAGH